MYIYCIWLYTYPTPISTIYEYNIYYILCIRCCIWYIRYHNTHIYIYIHIHIFIVYVVYIIYCILCGRSYTLHIVYYMWYIIYYMLCILHIICYTLHITSYTLYNTHIYTVYIVCRSIYTQIHYISYNVYDIQHRI